VRENPETFLREAADRGDGDGLPRFIEREFRAFLTCGAQTRNITHLLGPWESNAGASREAAGEPNILSSESASPRPTV
jgi:hypothetical protein